MIFRNHFLAQLSEDDYAALRVNLREVSLSKGEVLFEPGERVLSVYFPSTVVLSGVVVFTDGRSVEAATLGFEGVAGILPCLTDTPSTLRLFAQIPGTALKLPAEAPRQRAFDNSAFMRSLLDRVGASHVQAEQGAACNALHEAPVRLARWLLMTGDRTGSDKFPLTQDYMAIMVGVQRTTINAAAMVLKDRGLIQYSRGMVRILHRPSLEAVACECYDIIRPRSRSLVGREFP